MPRDAIQNVIRASLGSFVGAICSGEGLGSVFEVRLPLSTKAAKDAAAPGDDGGSSENQRRYRTLIADDNMDAADSLAITFSGETPRRSGMSGVAPAAVIPPKPTLRVCRLCGRERTRHRIRLGRQPLRKRSGTAP